MDLDGIYFDAAEVELHFAFIQSLTLTKSTKSGGPEPFRLLKHAQKFIGNLMGWKRADGRRLYRTGFLTMARKNTKTQTIAGLGLDLLVMDGEQSPEIYAAAKSREQASELFDAAADMVDASEELSESLKVTRYCKEIYNPANNGIFKALSAEGKSKHGSNPSALLLDEFHVWGPREEELHKALTTGQGARRQPLTVYLTTAGSDENSMCYAEYEYAKRVLDPKAGEPDPTYFALIYEIPKDADWTDRNLWPLANPALGDVVSWDFLEKEFEKAMRVPRLQAAWRQLYGNQWVNAASTWIPLTEWDACLWKPLRKTQSGNGSSRVSAVAPATAGLISRQ